MQILLSLKLEKEVAEKTSLLIYSSLYLNAYFTKLLLLLYAAQYLKTL